MTAVVLPSLVHRRTPNQSTRHGTPVTLLVWHESAGHYNGDVSWLRNPASEASAHLVVREDGGEVTQLVSLAEKAWHACLAYNPRSVGVEHSNITRKGYATERQLEVSARIFGWLCLHLGIPPRRSFGNSPGICRHLDLGALGCGHFECGMGDADFARFLRMVHSQIERGGYKRLWAT